MRHMSRIGLAFSCFFRLLFGKQLPARAAEFLPADAVQPALPPGPEKPAEKKEEPRKAEEPIRPRRPDAAAHQEGALALLALLQREARLVDFLRESIDGLDDADIGAAVRNIHRGARKVIEDYLVLEPVMPGDEDAPVTVPRGFDPAEIRLVGQVAGDPPFKGQLRHHGWRVSEVKLPSLADGVDRRVLAPAEVEIG
jgi:hypothetical protein